MEWYIQSSLIFVNPKYADSCCTEYFQVDLIWLNSRYHETVGQLFLGPLLDLCEKLKCAQLKFMVSGWYEQASEQASERSGFIHQVSFS